MVKEITAKDIFKNDLENVEQIPVVSTLLDVVCRITGMGFAAIARVTEDTWMACSVRDDIAFGLKSGGELEIKTTICNEIRQHQQAVIIDDVKEDAAYCNHHTPALYGFRSYISVPIFKKDGSFFGTLCAIDPAPKTLDTPEIRDTFFLFTDLIAFHLNTIEQIRTTETQLAEERLQHQQAEVNHKTFTQELEKQVQERTQQLSEKNKTLEKMNTELQTFTYAASHDLQEPLRKIRMYADEINRSEMVHLSPKGIAYFEKIKLAAFRMQSLINDLITYPNTNMDQASFAEVDLTVIINEVKQDLAEELYQKRATIETKEMCKLKAVPFLFRQVFSNLIGNALKFADPARPPHIIIDSRIIEGGSIADLIPAAQSQYCYINITDNGIGFNQEHHLRIFELFQRLHNNKEYEGTGVGLAIVKKIIESHNGIITAKGKVGEGAAFAIYIPIVKATGTSS